MPAVFTTAYLPPLSYMAECMRTAEVFTEIHETYRKQSIRNHCEIYGPNGRQKLSIPVNRVNGNHTLTKDIRISYVQNWQQTHWRSIETAYNNSPFFLFYRDHFEPFFLKKFDFLLDLNTGLLEVLFFILRMEKSIKFTDHFENQINDVKDLSFPHYTQVFESRSGFLPDLSVIDLIFNTGPEASNYLTNCF